MFSIHCEQFFSQKAVTKSFLAQKQQPVPPPCPQQGVLGCPRLSLLSDTALQVKSLSPPWGLGLHKGTSGHVQ